MFTTLPLTHQPPPELSPDHDHVIADALAHADAELRTRRQLTRLGLSDRQIASRCEAKDLVRIRRGMYVPYDYWRKLSPEARHLTQIIATARTAPEPPVFSHHSAAILHGFPIYRFQQARTRARSVAHIDLGHIVERYGLQFTAPNRTALDVACTSTHEVAVSVLDQAARLQTTLGTTLTAWREALLTMLHTEEVRRGCRRARSLIDIADPSSGSPLESVSRLYLLALGHEPLTQVEVRAPNGGRYLLDFELPGHNVLCEVDGLVKYRDPTMLTGRSPEAVLLQEKRRSDWIVGQTGKRLIRWGATELRSFDDFSRWLVQMRIPTPPRHTSRRGELLT
ncbi:type IV toxin-antitoxin system AbiEi family antitoxin domain-containing protein [Leucobacter sp. 1207-22]|uniref:type IV toxin-antitoxin system AbiEi family antitoxin domain-containing protein n=1 Tax=Leucobacter sp. 1207-22 TaxID=2604456 RepID=UPI0040644DAF